MNGSSRGILKEHILAYLKVLSRNLSKGTEEKYINLKLNIRLHVPPEFKWDISLHINVMLRFL